MRCQSAGLTEAARTRTRTSSSPACGVSMSPSRRTSRGEPYLSWTTAFTGERQLDRRWPYVTVRDRPGLASPTQRAQGERADPQDEQGDREREERDREGPEALDQPACLDGEVGRGGGFGACVHTSETKLAGAL